MLFADSGATVIKIEPPAGDLFRGFKPYRVWNRGKQSVTIDLRKTEGQDLLYKLAANADVLMESFQPGEANKLGIGYETIHSRFPRLVYASITAYGETGSRRDRPGYDALVSARLGIQAEQLGYRPGPHFNAFPMASYGTAALVVLAINTALYVRTASGRGQHVGVSMEDGVLAMSTMSWQWVENPKVPANYPPRATRMGFGGIRECGDGRYIQIHTGAPGALVRAATVLGLLEKLGIEPTAEKSKIALTPHQNEVLQQELPKVLMSKPRGHWIKVIQDADVAVMQVEPPGVILDDPQVLYNQSVAITDDPELGPIKTVGRLLTVPGMDTSPRGPAPTLGQHTDQVLKGLGLSDAELSDLRSSKVI
jgi:crotonobetainyl-CoA:carnitine CoA-transferase CaiB-like acyl-CoA transferase